MPSTTLLFEIRFTKFSVKKDEIFSPFLKLQCSSAHIIIRYSSSREHVTVTFLYWRRKSFDEDKSCFFEASSCQSKLLLQIAAMATLEQH